MELVIFIVALAFMLMFTVFALKFVEFAGFNLFFGLSIITVMLNEGLDEIAGFTGGVANTKTYGLDIMIFIPIFLMIFNALIIFKYKRQDRN